MAPFSRGQTGAGTALSLDGVDDHATIANSGALNVYPLTVMGWFRSFDQGLDRGIVNKYVVSSLNGYNVYFNQGRVRAWYFRDPANYVWDGGQGLDSGFVAGLWLHFAFTVDASGGKLYVNGVLRASRPWTGTPGPTTQAQVVQFGRYANNFLNGELDEVSIWNVALSQSAIAATMNRRLEPNEPGLLAYWRCDEGAGNSTADAVPGAAGNNAATLVGGISWVASGALLSPLVNTLGITAQTVNGTVNLTGEVNPLGRPTTAWFEWGTNTSYGNTTIPINVGSTSNFTAASAPLSGLQAGRTYHYRYVATNSNGRANGVNQSFTQPIWPPPGGVPPRRSSFYDPAGLNWVEYRPRPEWDAAVPMTIEAWVYRHDANRYETILSHEFPGSYWFGFAPRLRFYRGTNFAEVATPILAFKWTHVAVSYDGSLARFYVNGDLVGTRALNHNGAGKLRILRVGHSVSNPDDFSPYAVFGGNLDEIRLWSVARTAEEIRDGLYREVRGAPGLAAAFPRGGSIEEISGLVGSGGLPAQQIFGMIPRDLVVPMAAFPPTVDGIPDLGTEYLGAEQLVIRYPNEPTLTDVRAYFVHTSNDLFVAAAVSNDPPGDWNITNSWLSLYIDVTNAKPALAQFPQMEIRALLNAVPDNWGILNGDGAGGYYACFLPPGVVLLPCISRTLYQVGQQFCGGEISTAVCTEYRVSRLLLGSFSEYDGVAMGHFNFSSFGDQTFVPEDGFEASPATWLTMSYGEGSATLPRVRWSGRVLSGLTNTSTPLPNYRVSLIAGTVGHSQFTDAQGRFNFDVPLPTNETVFAQAELEAFGRYTLPKVYAGNLQPQFIFTNRVIFPRLTPDMGASVQLANVDFFVQRPLDPSAILSATPVNPMCGTSVRVGVPGGPGEIVTIYGTNLHPEMEFYLSPHTTVVADPASWTLIRAELKEIATDRTWVKVQTPYIPEHVRAYANASFIPSFASDWRWVAYDTWFRPGRIPYSWFGQFLIRRPPFPLVHGFNFVNKAGAPSLNEFLGCYGNSAYLCVGAFGHCVSRVPDPLYWALWWPVYYIWIDNSGGSCVGMAGTSAQFAHGHILPGDLDPLALRAFGIDNPGFPGDWDTSNTGGRYTRPPIPKDVWAHIRMNHGVQTTREYLYEALGQIDISFSTDPINGNPVARLNAIRANQTGYAISMLHGIGEGHAVTPWRVEDNFGGDPNISRMFLYENNTPCAAGAAATDSCVVDQWIDINLSANTYHYGAKGWGTKGIFTIPVGVYSGEHHAPALETVEKIIVIMVIGSADAHYTSPNGEWGWLPDGTFVNTLPGLTPVTPIGSPDNYTRSIPVFLPHSNALPSININVRDTNAYLFHAAAEGTLLQLEFPGGQSGARDLVQLGTHSNRLASFRFTPQNAHSNFIPKIGLQLGSNASSTFQWMGLAGESGKTQEFRALKDQRAVDYRNNTGKPTQHYLRIDAVDGPTTNNTCALFGPFNVPTGAVHCVVLQDWPRVKQVRSELDLNADGTPDQVTIVTGTSIDSDGDGMPDDWETLHQLDPASAMCDDGPDFDPDRDSVSNLGEYLSDTDPRDPNSVLRLTAALLPGNRVRLSWKAVPGRRYEILYTDDLYHIFLRLPGPGWPRVATSSQESYETTAPAGGTRFYQLRLVP